MKLKRIVLIGITVSLLIGSAIGLDFANGNFDIAKAESNVGSNIVDNSISIQDYLIQPPTNWGFYKEKVEVKGIFLTGGTVNYDERFGQLIKLTNDTVLNAMVIDVKNDSGQLTYKSNVDIAKEIGASDKIIVKDFTEKMEMLLENNIYPIARIVTFKDRKVGAVRPDLVLKTKSGGVWRDSSGNTWLDIYNEESWEYPIQLAEEAALMGFKEIQFDYVRFPTDGNTSNIDYSYSKDRTRSDAIADFLKHARERVEPLGAYISADIFGDIINVKGDSGIGQNYEALAVNTDILSPMVYPSHYNLGSYGAAYPNSSPYKIVYGAMKRAVDRMAEIKIDDKNKAILRPWLQDFDAGNLKNKYGVNFIPYGSEQIKAQIQATYDAGLKEWIFWNAGNKYTNSAFINTDIDIEQFQRNQQAIINQNKTKLAPPQNTQADITTDDNQESSSEDEQQASPTTEEDQQPSSDVQEDQDTEDSIDEVEVEEVLEDTNLEEEEVDQGN